MGFLLVGVPDGYVLVLAPAARAPGDRNVITLKAILNESSCHHNMNCAITLANNFSDLQMVISRISPVQLAGPVRKSTLNRPFVFPILGLGRAHNVLTHNAPPCDLPSLTHDCTERVNKAYLSER